MAQIEVTLGGDVAVGGEVAGDVARGGPVVRHPTHYGAIRKLAY